MNTFLPLRSFVESARVLDRSRLGKMRLEAWQILCAIRDPSYGWQHHPAVKMWRGYESALAAYGLAVCGEWKRRGYKDSMFGKFVPFISYYSPSMPPWLGSPAFHASHRAALLFKDPVHYSQFGWVEAPAIPNSKGSLPYIWPV